MKICNTIVANFILVILVLWIAFCVFYPSQIPTFTFTAITAGFAYQAYRYTKEKFRLELFEKRWEVYSAIVHFEDKLKGFVEKYVQKERYVSEEFEQRNTDAKELLQIANQSIVGLGWHRKQLLFGKDVWRPFAQIEIILVKAQSEWKDEERKKDMETLSEIVKSFPNLFKPYLYFGDYKYDQGEEKNPCDLCALCSFKIKNLLSSKTRKDEI
jgi:hypothetical protein